MESATEPGRREQNKRRTHEALIHAAARLFQENGYEATTVRDIAAAAGVGERTFFRYFPSKESLILQHVRDFIPLLEEAIRARPQGETPSGPCATPSWNSPVATTGPPGSSSPDRSPCRPLRQGAANASSCSTWRKPSHRRSWTA